jgi:hypothetical protein
MRRLVLSLATTLALATSLSLLAGPTRAETLVPKPADTAKPAKAAKVSRKVDMTHVGSIPPARAAIPFDPDSGLLHWYSERGNVAFPGTDRLIYCHGYGCLYQKSVTLDDGDLKELQVIFAPRSQTAEQEREAINLAVSWWEKRMAPLLGGPLDVRGSDYAHSGQPGQTDCLDEATNSTTILVYLQRHGLLRFHRVERPTSRGGLMIGVVHATAVFADLSDKEWIVDSWMRDSGDPNDVMTLDEWNSHVF